MAYPTLFLDLNMHDISSSQRVLEFAERIYHRADGIDNIVPADHGPNWSDRPHRFRAYRDQPRILLPGTSRLHQDYTECRQRRMNGPALPPTVNELALISYLMLAPLRRKLDVNWNSEPAIDFDTPEYGRGSASGGGLYPTQLYWVTSPQFDTPAALYHYSPSEHALTPIRHGDWTSAVAAAVGMHPGQARFRTYLLLTADFWSNCFKYHNFGLHVCAQDAGAVLATLQVACDALSLGQCSYSLFDDSAVNRIAGLDGRHESTFAVIGIGEPIACEAEPDTVGRSDLRFAPPIPEQRSQTVVVPAELLKIHELTCVTQAEVTSVIDSSEVARPVWAYASPSSPLEQSVRDFLPTILRQRRSAWGSLQGPHSLASNDLHQVLSFVWQRCGVEHLPLREALPANSLGISAHVSHVEGLARGVYSWDASSSTLVRSEGEYAFSLQETYSMGNYNVEEAACVLFVTADLPAIVEHYGARGYRILNAHVGLIAQATYIAAAAKWLDCGAVLGVKAQYVKQALRLRETRNVCLAIYLSQSQKPTQLFDYTVIPDAPKWEPVQ